MLKMSNSMKIMPISDRIQNIMPVESDIYNYNFKNYDKIQIPTDQPFRQDNLSSYISGKRNGYKPPQTPIIQISLASSNISSLYFSHSPIRIKKRSFNRLELLPKKMENSFSQTNVNNNLSNILKIESYPDSNQLNLDKINILEDSRNDLSSLEVKPIEQIDPSNNNMKLQKSNTNPIFKIPHPITTNNKILNSNINKMADKYINYNYLNYIKNTPKFNESLDFENNLNKIFIKKNDLNNGVSKPLENQLFNSVNNFSKFYLNNDTNNNININNNRYNNDKRKIFKYKETSNNDYFINNNVYNKNNYNTYNEYNPMFNVNNIYNNTMSNNYIKNNILVKELEPQPNFNLSEFIKLSFIGKGSEGVIYCVKWVKNNKKYALKKGLIQDLELLKSKKDEIKMLNDFRNNSKSDGVIKIYGEKCIRTKDGCFDFYEIMEFAERDWEKEIINRGELQLFYNENELMTIMAQIVKTLALLQKNNITHRDIKPQNIMLVNGKFKISDFGNSRMLKREGYCAQRIRGSEMFMSPVMFRGLHANLTQVRHNTYKSDVFSLGMCFLLAAGLSYNPLNTIRELYDMNAIYNIIYSYLGNRYSQNVLNILLSMLQVKEKLRPDFIKLESLFPQMYLMK